ncbi:unnamed protein product, partial [Vitis vinifera]|uniref:Uncharacterized protein n=1 Tax=Vitis vinifera TaxID=29760 RepID=D7UBR1_VITVI
MKGKIVVLVFESSQFTKAAVGLAPAISGSSPSAGSSLLLRWFFNYQSTANDSAPVVANIALSGA